MGERGTAEKIWMSGIGGAVFVVWCLFLGPLGLVALLGVAYAMVVQKLALGIAWGVLLATPVILAAAWVPVAFYALVRERSAKSKALAKETALGKVVAH